MCDETQTIFFITDIYAWDRKHVCAILTLHTLIRSVDMQFMVYHWMDIRTISLDTDDPLPSYSIHCLCCWHVQKICPVELLCLLKITKMRLCLFSTSSHTSCFCHRRRRLFFPMYISVQSTRFVSHFSGKQFSDAQHTNLSIPCFELVFLVYM